MTGLQNAFRLASRLSRWLMLHSHELFMSQVVHPIFLANWRSMSVYMYWLKRPLL